MFDVHVYTMFTNSRQLLIQVYKVHRVQSNEDIVAYNVSRAKYRKINKEVIFYTYFFKIKQINTMKKTTNPLERES